MTRRSGSLAEQGQGDRARAGADLVHAGALGELGADRDEQLGLAARDQDPLVDRDLDLAEATAAEDVLERLALAAAGDVALDLRLGLGSDNGSAVALELLDPHRERLGD